MMFKRAFWVALVLAFLGFLYYAAGQSAKLAARTEADAITRCAQMGGVVLMDYSHHYEQFYLTGCNVQTRGRER